MKRPRSGRLLSLLAGGLTLLLLLTGSLLSLQAGYDLPLELGWLTAIGCGLSLAFLGLYSLPRFQTLAVVLVMAVWGVLLWQCWDSAAAGGLALLQTAQSRLFPQTELAAADAASQNLALLLAAVPWAGLTGWGLLRARSAGLPLLLVWLPLVPAFCVNGAVCWPGLLMLGAASLSCLLSARPVGEESGRGGGRWRLLTLGVSALLLCGLVWLIPEERYVFPQWADTARIWLNGQTDGMSAQLFQIGDSLFQTTPQLSETVDLTQEVSPQYTGNQVLRVESSWSGLLYLRGYSMEVYTGESWEPLDGAVYDETLPWTGPRGTDTWRRLLEEWPAPLYPAAAQDGGGETLRVVDLGTPDDWVYTPYQISDCAGLTPELDRTLSRSDGQWQHEFSWTPADFSRFSGLQGEQAEAEALYQRFVRSNDLQLPDGLAERLAPYVAQAETLGVVLEDTLSPEHQAAVVAARQVAKLLAGLAEYDLDAPAVPEGEEFTLYFLEQSHRGYCVHFATAGTLLLRAMGVPARYAVGYVTPVTAGETTAVPDSAAHAWVEIYLSGYGWYPVEMTPASGVPGGGQTQDSPETPTETAVPETENPTEADQPENMTPEAGQPEQPQQNGQTAPERTAQAQPVEPEPDHAILTALLRIGCGVLLLAAILAALWGGRLLWLRRWERRLSQPDTNRAVLEVYGRFQALTAWGGSIPEEVTGLAQKARFSQHQLTPAERDQARRLLTRELRRVGRDLPAWKRRLFRLIWDR